MTTQEMLDERYGRKRGPGRRTGVIAAVIVIAAAIGVIGWMSFGNSSNSVDAATTGFTIPDHRSVVLKFQVTAPASTKVACVLEADDTEHGIVGWKVIELPASTRRSTAYRESIPTVAEATTGLVNTCWVP